MKTDTSHIETCRSRWHAHLHDCQGCFCSFYGSIPGMCEAGQILLDEYVSAIAAHRDIEHLTATEATR